MEEAEEVTQRQIVDRLSGGVPLFTIHSDSILTRPSSCCVLVLRRGQKGLAVLVCKNFSGKMRSRHERVGVLGQQKGKPTPKRTTIDDDDDLVRCGGSQAIQHRKLRFMRTSLEFQRFF